MKKSLFLLWAFLACSLAYGQTAEEHFKKGYELIEERKFAEAAEELEKAIELDPTGACGGATKGKAHTEAGYAYMHMQNYPKAEEYFSKSIALDGKHPFPRQNKAAVLALQNKLDEALKEMDALLKIAPDFAEGYVQRGFLHNTAGKTSKAKADLKKALSINKKTKKLAPQLVEAVEQKIKELK